VKTWEGILLGGNDRSKTNKINMGLYIHLFLWPKDGKWRYKDLEKKVLEVRESGKELGIDL